MTGGVIPVGFMIVGMVFMVEGIKRMKTLMSQVKSQKILLLSVALFLASLMPETYCVNGGCGDFGGGFWILFFGWMGILLVVHLFVGWQIPF